MLKARIIPTLLLRDRCLVKTVKFGKFKYIGDPCNTIRIFNELEVDELIFLDITASLQKNGPDYKTLASVANECFMPLAYGGGITTLEEAKLIFDIGFEKICINTSAYIQPGLVTLLADYFGSQAIIASIDVKRTIFGNTVKVLSGKKNTSLNPIKWAKRLEELGAGEILLTSIDREGTWKGFDTTLVEQVCNAVSIPVIAHGGCGSVDDVVNVIENSSVSAVATGSMITFQKQGMGVLINFPDALKASVN